MIIFLVLTFLLGSACILAARPQWLEGFLVLCAAIACLALSAYFGIVPGRDFFLVVVPP